MAPESECDRDPFVWIGSLTTGEITRRSPKNVSTVSGLYDGRGGFVESDATIEAHLAKIEAAAAVAIRKFVATRIGKGVAIPSEIARFLAWQAARTPGWMELVQRWANEPPFEPESEVLEPPPPGFEKIKDRMRPMCLEDPTTGTRREVMTEDEFDAYRRQGWKWIIQRDDHLEMLHLQAWYFQVRHFPRLSWVRLQPRGSEFFITSDRSVAWLADGYADTPPSALKHSTAQVVAPLTCPASPPDGPAGVAMFPFRTTRFFDGAPAFGRCSEGHFIVPDSNSALGFSNGRAAATLPSSDCEPAADAAGCRGCLIKACRSIA